MSEGLGFEIKVSGGKNLTALDPGDRAFVRESLNFAARQIRRALPRGRTADGRHLPAYSEKYARALSKEGKSTTPDNLDSGRMLGSMRGTVTGKKHGALRFSGGRPGATIKQQKKDGTVKVRNLTNQMLASILAFRKTGERMPTKPLNFVPAGRFMDIGKADGDHITRLYEKYHVRQLAGLPPAL